MQYKYTYDGNMGECNYTTYSATPFSIPFADYGCSCRLRIAMMLLFSLCLPRSFVRGKDSFNVYCV